MGGCRPAETYFWGEFSIKNEELVARSAAPASLRPERRSPCEHEQVQGGRQGEADVMIWGRRGRWGGSQDFLPGECECDEAQGKGVHAASWRGAAKVCGLCRCCAGREADSSGSRARMLGRRIVGSRRGNGRKGGGARGAWAVTARRGLLRAGSRELAEEESSRSAQAISSVNGGTLRFWAPPITPRC